MTQELTEENLLRELNGLIEAKETYQLEKTTLIMQNPSRIKVDFLVEVIPLYEWLLRDDG